MEGNSTDLKARPAKKCPIKQMMGNVRREWGRGGYSSVNAARTDKPQCPRETYQKHAEGFTAAQLDNGLGLFSGRAVASLASFPADAGPAPEGPGPSWGIESYAGGTSVGGLGATCGARPPSWC